jgi:CheY-like chemotaxis protein
MTWDNQLPTALVVVNDAEVARRLTDHLGRSGFHVDTCADADGVLATDDVYDVIVLDLRSGLMADLGIARQVGRRHPRATLVVRAASLDGRHPTLPKITFVPTLVALADVTATIGRTWRERSQLLPA